MSDIQLVDYTPGALGRIVELHGGYYAAHWNLGLYFEAKVATELAEFLSRFNPEHDGAWFAQVNGQTVGGIFIDGKGRACAGSSSTRRIRESAWAIDS